MKKSRVTPEIAEDIKKSWEKIREINRLDITRAD